ncbi:MULTISPECIES: hypothetical protein [Streptococcus]|uniref:Uncharacterized protein n=1 Tax=Streptococcus toyakuensis TaxID=2819619 RepID=A0ABM7UTA9_9STRE|nr:MULTISPECIES: hypothetical protein [Streptococcus]BDB08286.1 hypothetical protein STYK_01000 [Streptococcus toyakuensis]
MAQISTSFIQLLLVGDISNHDDGIVKSLQDNLTEENLVIPYDYIAEFVYQNENSNELNETLNRNIDYLSSTIEADDNAKKLILDKNLKKISSNYSLSQIQKSYISRVAKEVEQGLKDVNSQLNQARLILQDVKKKSDASNNTLTEAKSQLSQAKYFIKYIQGQSANSNKLLKTVQEQSDDIEQTKSSIYTDFIAILGIFSAFVFVMFGGIEVARAVFDIGDDLLNMNLSKMIIISCLMLIGVITLMYSLLLWIARITNKEIGNCMSSKCKEGCSHKWKHFYLRHSFYFSLIILLVIITYISFKYS